MLTLRVENTYSCGRESVTSATAEDPPSDIDPRGQDSEWFYGEIYGATGDGHSCGSTDDATYVVTVVGGKFDGMKWEI